LNLSNRLLATRRPDDQEQKKLIKAVKERVKKADDLGNLRFDRRSDIKDRLQELLEEISFSSFEGVDLIIDERFVEKTLSEIFGLGLLEDFLSDCSVTDIFMIDKSMVVIKDGVKVFMGEVFKDIEEVYLIIDRIKNNTSKNLDQRTPFLNTELYDGSRCSIIIPPASDKIYISIRVFNCKDYNLEDLNASGMFSTDTMEKLYRFVEKKKNILIAGCMGSGKTTLLNTMAKLIPRDEFINLIQDVPEIQLGSHPYARLLTTRPKIREVDNEINHEKLLYETLRMKADRIIIGEVRDNMAAYQMLQALNTGHRGSFSTIHSDSAYDALIRLEILSMEYRPNLSSKVLKQMVARAIDVVLYLECYKKSDDSITRKISEIAEVSQDLDQRGDYRLKRLI